MPFSPILPPSRDYNSRPEWSPLDPLLTLRNRYSIIFNRDWFIDLAQNPPSITQARRLSQKLATLQKVACLPEWIPFVSFSAENFVDFFALALANGPSATLDFVKIINDERKVIHKIELSLKRIYENEKAAVEPLIALEPLGLSPFYPTGMIFPLLAHTLSPVESRQSQYAILDWYATEEGDDILRCEAYRILKYPKARFQDLAFRFLHPNWTPAPDPACEPSLPTIPPAAQPEAPVPAPTVDLSLAPPPAQKIIWQPPPLPAGVEFSDRALRELRKEGIFAEHRLVDAIEVLGKYRQLKLREISPDDYQIACREKRYLDTRCFSDESSFTAFSTHYQIIHKGGKMRLDRHLKWGKSNNPISSMRVYYAWDDNTKTVVIGSAPRHLPVWNSR